MAAGPRGFTKVDAGPGAVCPPCRVRHIRLSRAPQAAGLARRATRDALACWQLAHLVETATLVVSELVGNALQHAHANGSPPELRLETTQAWLRIEVHDTDPRRPQLCLPGDLDEAGRGLVLVEALAAKWGVRETNTGKAVWAELGTGFAAGP
jgi:anti-sigma regulatory factor (Ser/Thr protein kinase)